MADQGKWFKLWCSSLTDAALENLTYQEWYCWARLGTYIKAHGDTGTVAFETPGFALISLFHVPDFATAISLIRRFPHCVLEEIRDRREGATDAIVAVKITYQNWHKYQGDYSTMRSREWRAKKRKGATLQEERRGEETKSPSPKGSPSSGSARSAPPDAPAPRASAVVVEDERREYGQEHFFAMGHRDSKRPENEFEWQHLEQSLTQSERVQSRWREKFYAEKAIVNAH